MTNQQRQSLSFQQPRLFRRLTQQLQQKLTILLLLFAHQIPAIAAQPTILVVYDANSSISTLDKTGITQALAESGISFATNNIQSNSLTSHLLTNHAAVILSELNLSPVQQAAISRYVENGGGLFATGKSAQGIEHVLGLQAIQPRDVFWGVEVRFDTAHPVSYGAFWDGPVMQTPPTPTEEIPSITQFLYGNDVVPAYQAINQQGIELGHWYNGVTSWTLGSTEASLVVNQFGRGRTVYSGALPGAYADWEWPRTWQSLILNSIEWINQDSYLVELGNWPDANSASFIFSTDTESQDMIWIVPELLDLFESLDLKRFGTFYVTAQAGGDEGTEGALDNPDVVEMMAQAGSEIGGHGDVHLGFSADSQAVQTQRMIDMTAALNSIVEPYGEKIVGFRAPHVDASSATFTAVKQAGLLYDSSDIDVWSETTRPFFNGTVWEAPPTMPMDYNIAWWIVPESDAQLTFIDKFDYIYARRGMFNMLTHPWIIGYQQNMLTALLQHAIDKKDVWMARQDDVMNWWIQRDLVQIQKSELINNTLTVHVKNTGSQAIKKASIWVKIPAATNPAQLTAKIGRNRVKTVLKTHNEATYLVAVIPSIKANKTVKLSIK